MTDMRPGGRPVPFTSAELDGAQGVAPDELAADARIARELESLAGLTPVKASGEFADRVMAAVAAEPVPAPARLARLALRRGALGAFLVSLRDAWRVTTSPGFPMAVRAQAMALVLIVAGVAAGSGMATAGALGLLDGDNLGPSPSVEQPSSSVDASQEPAVSPDGSPDGSMSPGPSESLEPSESPGEESAEPVETQDSGGSGGGDASTPKPTDDHTAQPTRTPSPTSTPHDESQTPAPGDTPKPTETPHSDG